MLTKKPRVQPLQVSDVLAIMVRQQSKRDKTQEYKQILRKYSKIYEEEYSIQEKDRLQLPEFATKQMTYAEIFDYHITFNKLQESPKYEKMLEKVNNKIKETLVIYHDKLQEGQQHIDELIEHSGQAFTIIDSKRKHIKYLQEQIQKGYGKIAPKLRKISNISKILEITKIWGKTKLPYLLAVNVSKPTNYNVTEVLRQIQSAIQIINENGQNSKVLRNVVHTLQSKKQVLIKNVYEEFSTSIINFRSIPQYKLRFQQYQSIKGLQNCPNILTQSEIQILIKTNASTMFYTILKKLTPLANVDLLNENSFLNFYDEILEEYVIYFRSWHYVTKFHIDSQTEYGKLFLENRRQVFRSLSETLGSSIDHSKKFLSLQYQVKLELVEKIQDYLEAGQKWMGKCESIKLQKLVTQKLKKQLENIFKIYNNLIKTVLTQELSPSSLQNNSSKEEKQAGFYKTVEGVDYQKLSKFMNHSQEVKIIEIPQIPKTSTKIGTIFTQMISQYLERSKLMETSKSVYIDSIIEHFQFIIFMIFQVCLKDSIKQRKNYNIREKISELDMIKLEEAHLKLISELVKDELFRKKYFLFYQFLKKIGKKFDGVQIVGIIDVNKAYDSPLDDIVTGYTRLLIKILSDLLKIVQWIIPISHQMGSNTKKSYVQHLFLLTKQLCSLVFENHGEWLQKKYMVSITPIISKLKWEIKKFNQETALQYKDYKMKFLQIFRNTTLITIAKLEDEKEIVQILQDKELEIFYKSLMESYGKIQKINDNGRQLIKLDSVEISKILSDIGVQPEAWAIWFQKYLQIIVDRSSKSILDKISKLGLLYSPLCWRTSLLWVISDFSSRERREYGNSLTRYYLNALKDSIM